MTQPILSILIVNYRTTDWLARCLRSLKSLWADPRTVEGWVVDNASNEPEKLQALALEFPQIHWIRNARNVGFAKANNQAMAQATGRWFWLLNPDTEWVAGRCLDWLERFDHSHPKAGMVGTRLIYPDGRLQLSWGADPHFFTEAMQRWVWNRLERSKLGQAILGRLAGGPKRVDWVLGASFFVRREAYGTVGGMDERFFLYFEEVDWARRMRQADWEVWYDPTVVVCHWRGRAMAQADEPTVWEYRKSQLAFYRKHYGQLAGRLLLAYLRFKYGSRAIAHLEF